MCPFKPLSELVLKCDTGINLSESCCGGVEPPLMEIFGRERRYLSRERRSDSRAHSPDSRARFKGFWDAEGRWGGGGVAAVMRCGGGWPAPSGCNLQRCALLFKTLRVFLPFRYWQLLYVISIKKEIKKAFPNFLFHNMATVTHLKIGHTEVQCIISPVVCSC